MAEFQTLKEQFEQASARWPNLQSLLVRWPEDQSEPDVPLMDGLVDVPSPEGELHCVATGYGARMDTENGRYRSGFAGKLVLQRDFGKLGTISWRHLTEQDIEANERFRVLCDEAGDLLDQQDYGLSADTMQWKARTRWRLAVHELVDPPWTRLAGYGEGYEVQTLNDLFLDSAFAIGVICKHDTPYVNDDDHHNRVDEICDELTPQQRRIVKFLWNQRHWVSWDTLAERCGIGHIDETEAVRKALQRLVRKLLENDIQDVYLENDEGRKRVKLIRPK